MTEITIYHEQNQDIEGFRCTGHAGYDVAGQDIVCASISVLTINTINAIETFTSCSFTCEVDEELGDIEVHFPEGITQEAALLVDTMILGLKAIQNDYGNEYIILDFEEV